MALAIDLSILSAVSRWLTAMILSLAPCAAFAHPLNCNNETQPAVVMSGCCGKEDYRALQFNEVRPDGEGWDVFLDGKWHEARQRYGGPWLIAQPTVAGCWGIWYRRGRMDADGKNEIWSDHDGNTDDYAFYCLEQPAED